MELVAYVRSNPGCQASDIRCQRVLLCCSSSCSISRIISPRTERKKPIGNETVVKCVPEGRGGEIVRLLKNSGALERELIPHADVFDFFTFARKPLVWHRAAHVSPLTSREAELQYLSGGEAMLLLRDLVRRKVLRDHAVPSTAKVSPTAFFHK